MKTNYFTIASITLFAISLTQKTYCTDHNCGEYLSGLSSFLVGFAGIFLGGALLTWLANPLLILSWITFKKKNKISLLFSAAATAIGLSFLLFEEIMIDEGGHYGKITGYMPGYWLWIASMATMLVGNIFTSISGNHS